MKWQESYNYAISQGGRIPNLDEIKAHVQVDQIVSAPRYIPIGDPWSKDWF